MSRDPLEDLCLPLSCLPIAEDREVTFTSEDEVRTTESQSGKPKAVHFALPGDMTREGLVELIRQGVVNEHSRVRRKIQVIRTQRKKQPNLVSGNSKASVMGETKQEQIDRQKLVLQLRFLENQLAISADECERLRDELDYTRAVRERDDENYSPSDPPGGSKASPILVL